MDIWYEKLPKYYNSECVVLVCLLLFCLARNCDSKAISILIPVIIIAAMLWLSEVVVNQTFTLRSCYWPGRSLVNADTEIKAPWDWKDHFWFQIVRNQH